MENPHGILVVDKDAGMTSHDVVGVIRKLFRTKRVGHTGTLDPDATGVLVLCLGNATRVAEYLSASRKHYVAEVVFGIETSTLDASGTVVAEQDASHLTANTISNLLPSFRGRILQIPPMVSALHHEGKRLYDLARQGIIVEREARQVEIDLLELTDFTAGEHPVARLEITCSTGTYIRSLASDIGSAAGTGGMMRSLRRTWVGASIDSAVDEANATECRRPFSLANSYTLNELRERANNDTLQEVLLPLATALMNWAQVVLTPDQVSWIRHGRALALDALDATLCRNSPLLLASSNNLAEDSEGHSDEAGSLPPNASEVADAVPVALMDAVGEVIAIAHVRAGNLQPVKVFA